MFIWKELAPGEAGRVALGAVPAVDARVAHALQPAQRARPADPEADIGTTDRLDRPPFETCRCGAETRLLRRDAGKGLRAYVVRCACGREGGLAYTTEQGSPAVQHAAMERAIERWEP